MLIERLMIDAVGQALHHQRPVGDDRKNQRRDARVVPKQVALGSLALGPEHLVQVGDFERVAVGQLEPAVLPRLLELVQLIDRARRRRGSVTLGGSRPPATASRRCLRRRARHCSAPGLWRHHGLWQHVVSQSQIGGMSQLSIVGDLGVAHLRDQQRPHPVHGVRQLGRRIEWAGRRFDALQQLEDAIELLAAEAGADVTDVAEAGPLACSPALLVRSRPSSKRAEIFAGAFRRGPAADDEFVLQRAA